MGSRVRFVLCCSGLLIVMIGVNGGPQVTQDVQDYEDDVKEGNTTSTNGRLGTQGSTILCYVGSWVDYEQEPRDLWPVNHLDGSLCTHAIYAYARLCDNGTLCPSENGDSTLDTDNWSYRGLAALKNKWPDLRVGVSIGGWAEGSERFSLLAASSWSRNQFINALIETLRRYNMTAVELAWISPTIRSGGKPYDRENYVDLIRDVSRALRPRGWHLGVAIKVDDGKVDSYYQLSSIARYADWLHIQAFDFHGLWEEFTGLNAPLRWIEGDRKNVEFWMKYIAKRVGPEKLLLGMPLYGRSWRLVPSPVPGGPGAAALGETTFDGSIGASKLISYKELCAKLKSHVYPPWESYWDNVSMTPWAVQEYTTFISYDDQRSLVAKVDFARKMNVAGVAVFTLDLDDYAGDCGEGKFPLMHAIKAAIKARLAT